MGSFSLKEKVRKVGIKETAIERSVLRIGRAGENDIIIEDPLVSPSHCKLEWIGGQCRLSDTQSVSGTYVDGQPIDEFFVIRDGQTITLGLNEIKLDLDMEREVCGIFVEENVGTGEKQLHREIHITVRPWYQTPKWYALAGVLLCLAPVAAMTVTGRQDIYQNGLVSDPHREALAARGTPNDCTACHVPFVGATTAKCAACHDEHLGIGSTHPIGPLVKDGLRARAAGRDGVRGSIVQASFTKLEGLQCIACHVEHAGAHVGDGLAPWKHPERPRSVPPGQCRTCHATAHSESAPGGGVAIGDRTKEVRFDAFSHRAHDRQGVAQCDRCHVPNQSPSGPDFAFAGYSSCIPCHESQRVHDHGIADHGQNAKQECLKCHASATDLASLSMVREDLASMPALRFVSQHHDMDKRCAECHANPWTELPALSQGKPFDHFSHLASLTPAPAAGRTVAQIAGQCMNCHVEIPTASSVEASKAVPPLAACRVCHTKVEEVAGAAPVTARKQAREVVRFAHQDHVGKGRIGSPTFEGVAARSGLSAGAQRLHEQACFACHQFADDAPGVGLPSVIGAPSDCRSCHLVEGSTRHVDAGLSSCDYCHVGKESVFERAARDARLQRRPGSQPYDHHLDTIGKERTHPHASVECAACHVDVLQADGISELRFPAFEDQACQSCHGNLSTVLGDLDCSGCHKFHLDPHTTQRR